MGYILKKGGGAGTGDATAANQQKQIDQLAEASSYPSVLKDNADLSVFANATQRSVLKDINGESVFIDNNTESAFLGANARSVFKVNSESLFKDVSGNSNFNDSNLTSVFKTTSNNSILTQSKISNTATSVISFQNTTPATLATDIQTILTTNPVTIIQICYADAGGVAPNPHTALIIYNTI